MKAYVVTGTTKGIGRAIAEAVVGSKDQLLSLSREPDKEEPFWRNIQCDLRDHAGITDKLQRLMETVFTGAYESVVLVNNAGVLDPIGPIQDASEQQIIQHLLVNQVAPALLMSAFIRLTASITCPRRIINISSGAAKHPYSGWALYCASKAALDMMTLCVATEQEHAALQVPVCAVYPGRVETGMQQQIRGTDKTKFPRQPEFVAAKQRGDLSSAGEVARLILTLDHLGELRNGGIYDLRDTTFDGHRPAIKTLNPAVGD